MKTLRSSVEFMPQEGYDLNSIFKQIEIAGRTCYKSEDRITDGSAEKFVNMLKTNKHGAMLEHGTIYLKMNIEYSDNDKYYYFFLDNPYSEVTCFNNIAYITTNYRVLFENFYLDALKFLCEPDPYYHEPRYTFKFICDRGVSAEFNRHRVNSMGEQSTRYCNYSKDKFGNQVSVILPEEFEKTNDTSLKDYCRMILDQDESNYKFEAIDYWMFANLASEWSYLGLVNGCEWKPQQARRVLPLDLKTELVHTAFLCDWKHFLSLRSPKYGAKGVHPDAAKLGDMVYDIMIEKHLLEEM